MRVREEPNVTRRLVEADREVDAAIHEIDRTAVIDQKDLEDHPRVDSFQRRFGRIVELLSWGGKRTVDAHAAGVTRRTGISIWRSNICTGRPSIFTGITNSGLDRGYSLVNLRRAVGQPLQRRGVCPSGSFGDPGVDSRCPSSFYRSTSTDRPG
jgi:hypothetical protein